MRILFAAIPDSVHTARWIGQLAGTGWDLHLFPSLSAGLHPQLDGVTVHDRMLRPHALPAGVRAPGAWPWLPGQDVDHAERVLDRWRGAGVFPWEQPSRAARLARVVERLQPDIVHSLEIQHAGYLATEARALRPDRFPPWIVTNWGSDIYLYGQLAEHKDRIRAALAGCSHYMCECERDVRLAREFGFSGEVLPVLPSSGGIDIERAAGWRQPGPTSARRLVLLKGYQGWAGRALVGLRAIELCADALRGYRIGIYLASPEVLLAAELTAARTGLSIEIIPRCSHDEMLRWHGQARISIGLSIGDAASTSFLEALVMKSFPIQSCTSCANEWVRDGETAFLTSPDDPNHVAAALVRALRDDALVDRAVDENEAAARARLAQDVVRPQVIGVYERIAGRGAAARREAHP